MTMTLNENERRELTRLNAVPPTVAATSFAATPSRSTTTT